jgi:hypothetical protein
MSTDAAHDRGRQTESEQGDTEETFAAMIAGGPPGYQHRAGCIFILSFDYGLQSSFRIDDGERHVTMSAVLVFEFFFCESSRFPPRLELGSDYFNCSIRFVIRSWHPRPGQSYHSQESLPRFNLRSLTMWDKTSRRKRIRGAEIVHRKARGFHYRAASVCRAN